MDDADEDVAKAVRGAVLRIMPEVDVALGRDKGGFEKSILVDKTS